MQEQILLSIPISEFKLLIIDAVNNCLMSATGNPGVPPPEIIVRRELCKRLYITEPTAIRWEKKGKINCFRIGSNVRYNWTTVINELERKTKGGAK